MYLEAFDTKHETVGHKDAATARFAVFRVERDAWGKLSPSFRPTHAR